ncbi:MAG: branched-chain amino acid ABC transporter permease [Actinomycetota bacterium]
MKTATTDYRQDLRLLRTRGQRLLALAVVLVAIAVPFALSSGFDPPLDFPWTAWFPAINLALIATIGAAAFNLLLGYTHQVSVAHAAFLMLGTMLGAWMGQLHGVNFVVVMVASLIVGGLVGVIVGLPALRFQGLYLLIATFGVHFFFLLAYKKFIVGYFGFNAIIFTAPEVPAWLHWLPFITPDDNGIFAIAGNFRWYWVLLPMATLSVLFLSNVVRSREGRAFMAIAEKDVSASLIGINVTRTKLTAFALSSAFASLTGALGAYYIGARGEASFPFELVLFYAIMIIVGGISSFQGAVFGAFFYYMAPVLFDWIRAEVPGIRSVEFLQDYANETNLAIFGVLIVIVLVARPTGLVGVWKSMKGYVSSWPYSS